MCKITADPTWNWIEQDAFYHTFGVFFSMEDDSILADIYGDGRCIESNIKIPNDQIFINPP